MYEIQTHYWPQKLNLSEKSVLESLRNKFRGNRQPQTY